MSKWEVKRLGDVAPFKYGKSMTAEKRTTGKYDVYSSGGVCGLSDEHLASKGIIIGRKGTAGSLYYSKTPFFCIDTAFYVDEVTKNNDMLFMYYYMQILHLSSFNNDAAVPGLNRNLAHKLKIQLPPLPTQQRMADILSAYDDLIENNNRRIELLEKAAQDLYKEWFVRFHFPGYKTAKFENGIPQGWEVKRLAEFVYVTDGTHDTPKQKDDGFYLVTGRSIINDFIDFDLAYHISEEDHKNIKKRSGLDNGDILFSNIGTVGSISIVDYDIDFSVKNVIILKIKTDFEKCFLYCLFKNNTTQELFKQQTNGSSQQFISLGFMRKFKILVPNQQNLECFSEKISPIIQQKYNLFKQNRNLVKQRDMLLPRLMSGKLEVLE